MKRYMKCCLLAIGLMLLLMVGAQAASVVASGDCGSYDSTVTWKLTDDGTITFSGSGGILGMPCPWDGLRDKIKKVVIEDGVTSIGMDAFRGCSNLTNVIIPDSVTEIGYQAFSSCGITSVTIPNGVTIIHSNAFECCGRLTSITIANSVTSIGQFAFNRCSGLTSITIPNNVTIGGYAFQFCDSLTSITVSNMEQPDSYYTVLDNVLFSKDTTVLKMYPAGKKGSYTIPNNVTEIGPWAFFGCRGLTSVSIPNSVTKIGGEAFWECTNLADAYYDGTEAEWRAKVTVESDRSNMAMTNVLRFKSTPSPTPAPNPRPTLPPGGVEDDTLPHAILFLLLAALTLLVWRLWKKRQ